MMHGHSCPAARHLTPTVSVSRAMNHASQPTSRRKFLQTTRTLAAGTVRIHKDQRIAPDNIAWDRPPSPANGRNCRKPGGPIVKHSRPLCWGIIGLGWFRRGPCRGARLDAGRAPNCPTRCTGPSLSASGLGSCVPSCDTSPIACSKGASPSGSRPRSPARQWP